MSENFFSTQKFSQNKQTVAKCKQSENNPQNVFYHSKKFGSLESIQQAQNRRLPTSVSTKYFFYRKSNCGQKNCTNSENRPSFIPVQEGETNSKQRLVIRPRVVFHGLNSSDENTQSLAQLCGIANNSFAGRILCFNKS